MSKKWIILGVSVIFLLVGMGVTAYIVYAPKKEVVPSSASSGVEQLQAPDLAGGVKGDLVYKDGSGFSFKYPSSLTVADVTPSAKEYYSMLSLTKDAQSGRITVKDTTYKNLDDWLAKSGDIPAKSTLVGAVNLGGVSARQYKVDTKLVTAGIDQGVLYLLDTPAGSVSSTYWDDVHNLIVTSFAFTTASSSGSSGSGSSGSSDVTYEEEVVE